MTPQNSLLDFRPMTLNDLTLMYHWFKTPEINQWYARGREWSQAEIDAKYAPRIKGEVDVPSFIITLDQQDIGFIQYYPFSKIGLPDGMSYDQMLALGIDPASTAGIDLFIGETTLLGKGLGRRALNQFVEQIIPHAFTTLFIDPAAHNLRAIHAYLKAGFVQYPIQLSDKVYLLYRSRSDISA